MSRILIFTPIVKMGEYDIWSDIDYTKLYDVVDKNYNGKCTNTGNKVWMQGIISEISTPENELVFYKKEMSPEQINDEFDMVLLSTANLFCKNFLDEMKYYTKIFRKIKIPIYVISCGAQANSYDDIKQLCKEIKDTAAEFISTIYQTGGEFGVRGYFTKEVFDGIISNSAVVTGCPSLFQNGRNLSISLDKVSEKDFKPVFNGILPYRPSIFSRYANSIYIDQNEYFDELYRPHFWDNIGVDFKGIGSLIKKYGIERLLLLAQDRIQLFADITEWHEYLLSNGFNFSFGSRIHGNIMSLLCGIPVVICARDSRTREMAEFYDIPYFVTNKLCKQTIYDIYEKVDYTKFNETFPDKYDAFQSFLVQHGIVKKMNDQNIFWSTHALSEHPDFSDGKVAEIESNLTSNYAVYYMYDKLIRAYRKVKKFYL